MQRGSCTEHNEYFFFGKKGKKGFCMKNRETIEALFFVVVVKID